MLNIANMISFGLMGYLLLGFLFSLWFITLGLKKTPIEGKGIILRLMLIPGAVLIWPLLIFRKAPS